MSTATNAVEDGRGGQPSLNRVIGPGLLLLFIMGDILGTGVYALTGKVAAQVGGIVWLPFLAAFIVALLTAFSYLELVTKYPQAAGAALYTHRAFKSQFFTFIIAFTVMCSGLTSSASASKAFAGNLAAMFGWDFAEHGMGLKLVAGGFLLLVAAINFRGVSESVKLNVVLTCIELSGLLIVIVVGLWAITQGQGDFSRLTQVNVAEGKSSFSAVTAATALAFFAMVGFEDSVNMAEETKDPVKTFPKMLLTGLCLTGVVYVIIAVTSIALVSPEKLGEGSTPLLQVVQVGAPHFPTGLFAGITMFAVSNTALLNMMMASRLLYGLAHEGVLPRSLGKVSPKRRTPWVSILFTTLIALGLVWFSNLTALGGTTALLLLVVFTVVNIAVLVLRKDRADVPHFKTPTIMAVLGAITAAFLASPLSGRANSDYKVAGWLLLVGMVLGLITYAINRFVYHQETRIRDIEHLGDVEWEAEHPHEVPPLREALRHSDDERPKH
ncbi:MULTISPECIES: APC family permease [unclassified Luteococcus]|uniref:APC family permease n=1 Tax=unclassified Luteococcus TaxID=2639923 RepID=UPI00313D6BDC